MLSPNLVQTLDLAAAKGILDYDGAAFITGTQPRYMGSPEFMLPQNNFPQSNLQQPQKDEMVYVNPNGNTSQNPKWKKVLFGVLVGGLALFGLSKLSKLSSLKKSAGNAFNKTNITNGWNKVCDFFKDNWNKLFKKKSAPTP